MDLETLLHLCSYCHLCHCYIFYNYVFFLMPRALSLIKTNDIHLNLPTTYFLLWFPLSYLFMILSYNNFLFIKNNTVFLVFLSVQVCWQWILFCEKICLFCLHNCWIFLLDINSWLDIMFFQHFKDAIPLLAGVHYFCGRLMHTLYKSLLKVMCPFSLVAV